MEEEYQRRKRKVPVVSFVEDGELHVLIFRKITSSDVVELKFTGDAETILSFMIIAARVTGKPITFFENLSVFNMKKVMAVIKKMLNGEDSG